MISIAKHAMRCSDLARQLYKCVTDNECGHDSKPTYYNEELCGLDSIETILRRLVD